MNDIIKFLNFEDDSLETTGPIVRDGKRYLTIMKKLTIEFCPVCSYRMHSKGIYERTVNHPIMQDGLPLVLKVQQRRWRCTNPNCSYTFNDKFSFLEAHKQNTNLTDVLIVEAFKDPAKSASRIAADHNVSDTYAITTFAKYVDMPRRQLSTVISIDEVKVDVVRSYKYALVIQDFITGEPIDLLPNRRQEFTEPYFQAIPLAERKNVKYLITDMYRPYLSYIDKYFPDAISAVDSFHVIKSINHVLLSHMRKIANDLDRRDRSVHAKREQEFHRRLNFTHSRDYLVIKKYPWVILKNQDDLKYSSKAFWNRVLNQYTTIYDLEERLFKIAPELKPMRNLKEKYITFNNRYGGNPRDARPALRELITLYRNSGFPEFERVANMLEEHFEAIINSFIMIKRFCKDGEHISRLSNGPMEALNRIVKDQKRSAHGYHNFDHLRNRFLFSQRKNAQMLAIPRKREEVVPTGKPRGPYKKK